MKPLLNTTLLRMFNTKVKYSLLVLPFLAIPPRGTPTCSIWFYPGLCNTILDEQMKAGKLNIKLCIGIPWIISDEANNTQSYSELLFNIAVAS